VDTSKGAHQFWNVHDWHTWTSFSGDNLGPDIAGFALYWGPHGLVRGDTLGERLANWAGVKPMQLAFK
jgi:hypothetical protein